MFEARVAIQPEGPAVPREIPSIEGLCRNCLKATACIVPRDPSRPIWSCDEFAGIDFPPILLAAPILCPSAFPVVEEEGAGLTELEGLCKHCARRSVCAYPKPPGGVWSCDELA